MRNEELLLGVVVEWVVIKHSSVFFGGWQVDCVLL